MAKHKATQEQADLPTSPAGWQSTDTPKGPEAAPATAPVVDATKAQETAPVVSATEGDGKGKPKRKEPKDARFRRLAPPRVNKALAAIRNVGRLANRNTYSYTEVEAVNIVNALIDAVNKVRYAYAGDKDAAGGFTL